MDATSQRQISHAKAAECHGGKEKTGSRRGGLRFWLDHGEGRLPCRPDKELLFSCYALSKGNPIEDARSLFRQLREAIGDGEILGLGITGYGKDLLKGILGADCGVVETIAHASAGLHYFPRCRLHLRRRRR